MHIRLRQLDFQSRLLDQLSPFIKDVQVTAIDEETMALASGGLFENAKVDHVAQRLCDRWSGDADPLCRRRDCDDRVSLHVLEDPQHGGCGSAECLDLFLIAIEKVQNFPRGVGSLVGCIA